MWWQWVVAAGAYFVAGFLVWRKMKEEYEEEEILKLVMLLGLAAVVGAVVFRTWGVVGLGLVTMAWWCRRKDWAFWEWLDTVGPVGLAVGALVILNWVWAAGVMVVWLIGRTYRRWKWYRSGRPGLVGLAAIIFVAGGEITVANRSGYHLYWGGLEAAQWIGIWSVVASLVAIYLRAGRKVTIDLKIKWPKETKKA